MSIPTDILRRLENLIRLGTIAEVDGQRARVRVTTGGLTTDWLPWGAERAGDDSDWNPPSVGEQVVVFSPSGNPATGVVLGSLYSAQFGAPDSDLANRRHRYADGAVVEYNAATHTLRATLPAGGTANLNAPGGVTIVGDVTITGTVTVSEDVIASGISLVNHRHGGVQSGNGTTGVPQ